MEPIFLHVLFVILASWMLEKTYGLIPYNNKDLACPILCQCEKRNSVSTALCSNKGLYSIEIGFSLDIQELDLSNNSISVLSNDIFSRAGLTKIIFMNLSQNSIDEIALNAFHNLMNLTVLDLSKNIIDYIEPNTFYFSKNLKRLFLSGNKFNLHVPELQSTTLTELDLSSCRIHQLQNNTFHGLKKLVKLNLSGNFLQELSAGVLVPLPYLRHIDLQNNLWSCKTIIINLTLYLKKRKIQFEPVCQHSFNKINKIIDHTFELESHTIADIRNSIDSLKTHSWILEDSKDTSDGNNELENVIPTSFVNNWDDSSPFWFLMIGFLLGCGATMIVTYLWLSTTISCLIPRIRRETGNTSDPNSQRESLLRHLWHQENANENSLPASLIPTCPGTPPPPYREVMLHRNLYPRAPQTLNGRVILPTSQ